MHFNFVYCCDDMFVKKYGRYMKSLRKQFGKKEIAEFKITGYDVIIKSMNTHQLCPACLKLSGNGRTRLKRLTGQTGSKFFINVEK